MDAVMYCGGALERFAAMTTAERGEVLLEIATLDEQGLDVNDWTQSLFEKWP